MDQPIEQETITEPVEGEIVALPEAGEIIAPPEAGEIIALPVAEEIVAQPTEGEIIAQSSKDVENVPLDQIVEEEPTDQPQVIITINQPRENVTMDQLREIITVNQPREKVIIYQLHENVAIDQQQEIITENQPSENIIIDQQSENVPLDQINEVETMDQSRENVIMAQPSEIETMDQSCETVTMDQTGENVTVDQVVEGEIIDQTHENVPMDQQRENVTMSQPQEKGTVVQPRENVTMDQPSENVTIDQPRENVTIDQPRENVTIEQPHDNVTIDQPHENKTIDQQTDNETMEQPRENVMVDQPRENVMMDQPSERVTPDQIVDKEKVDQPCENKTMDQPRENVIMAQPRKKFTMDEARKKSITYHASEKSTAEQSNEKAVLVFCKTCGSCRLCDVTKELQKLFMDRNLKPNVCGICHKQVELENDSNTKSITGKVNIKEEQVDDDYKEIDFTTHLSKTSKNASKADKNQISGNTAKTPTRLTRLRTGALKPSSYVSISRDFTVSAADKDKSCTSGDDSDSDSNDSDEEMKGDGEAEKEMVIDLGRIKEEENAEAEMSRIETKKPNMTDRQYMDPVLLKFLVPSDDPHSYFVCKVCEESCKFIGSFAKHVSRHTHKKAIQKPYRCQECKQNFEVRAFKKHFQRHHVKSYECTYSKCEFAFKSDKDLKGHLDYHKGLRSNCCNVCGLAYISIQDLKKHEVNHASGEKLSCEHCDKTYNHLVKLREHKRKMHADKKHTCKFCSFSCFTTIDLENHNKMHLQVKVKCEKCQHVFTSQFVFDFHLQIQSCKVPGGSADGIDSKTDVDVDIANVLEFLGAELVAHMAKPKSADEPFNCKHCANKEFHTARSFLHHLEHGHPRLDVPSGDHLFHCNMCSRKYEHKCDLTKHLRSHSDDKPYVCTYENCDKAYKRKDVLNRHHEMHASAGDKLKSNTLTEGDIKEIMQQVDPQLMALVETPRSKEFPFTCKNCDVKQFKSANVCLNHIKQMHPKIDCPTFAYSCDQCDQRFEMKGALVRHVLGHSDYRPFVCSIDGCDKSFKRKDKLKAHQELHTTGGKRHMCSTCGMWFSSQSGVKKHINNVHLKILEHKCSFCGKAFPMKSRKDHHEKTKHLGMREWVCELCGKAFNKRVELTQHTYHHSGEKPYACEYCEYRCVRLDYLKKHVKTHTGPGEKPFRCSVCSEQFLLRSTLIIHMKKHHGLSSPEKLKKVEKSPVPVVIKKRKLSDDEPGDFMAGTSLIPTTSGEHVDEDIKTAVGFLEVFKDACTM